MGLLLICGGGYFLVESAKVLAAAFGMSQWVIAMTIVAMGTSVPELVISLVAIIKKHHGISAGNLIGSNLFNIMGVLGVAGALRPLTVDPSSLQSIISLIVLTVIVLIFMRTGWQISRRQGVALILISLVIWGYEIYRQSPQTTAAP